MLNTASSLDPEVFEPFVILPDDLPYEGELSRELERERIPYQAMKLGVLRRRYFNPKGIVFFLVRSILSTLQIIKFSRQYKIDLIHSNTTAVHTGGWASHYLNKPHIWHVHEIIIHPALLNKITAHSLHLLSERVVAVSGAVRDNLLAAQRGLAKKTVVIHNGIDLTPFLQVVPSDIEHLRATWGIPEGAIVIGCVGRISMRKGQEFLLRSVANILQERPDVHLVLVGGGIPGNGAILDQLKKFAEEKGIKEQIHFDGFRHDIASVHSAFDIFVLPSILPDPFPTVVLEAMAAGKPVVGTAHGGVIEQVVDGYTGCLVSPTEISEMSLALETLIANPQTRQKMGSSGRQRLLECFTIDKYMQSIISLYKEYI